MRFCISKQYPDKWIHGNREEPPTDNCLWVPFKPQDPTSHGYYVTDIEDLHGLLVLQSKTGMNLFINFGVGEFQPYPEIVLTKQNDID
jgi:hypothetical protein